MQKLLELYKQWKGEEPANVQQIPGAGSNRTYFRLTDSDGKNTKITLPIQKYTIT